MPCVEAPESALASQTVAVNVPCEKPERYTATIIASQAKVSQLMFPVKDLEGTWRASLSHQLKCHS